MRDGHQDCDRGCIQGIKREQSGRLLMSDEFTRFIRSEVIHTLTRIVPRLRITELLLTSNKYKKTANPIKLCLSPLDFAQAKFPLIVPLANRTTKLKIGVSLDGLFDQLSSKGESIQLHPLPPTQSKLLFSPLSVLPFTNTAYLPSPPSVFLLSMLGRLHKHEAKVVSLNSRVLGVRALSDPSTPVPPNLEVELDSSLSEMDNSQSPLVNTSPTSEQNPSFCSDLISVLSLLSFTFCRSNHCVHPFSVSNDPISPVEESDPLIAPYFYDRPSTRVNYQSSGSPSFKRVLRVVLLASEAGLAVLFSLLRLLDKCTHRFRITAHPLLFPSRHWNSRTHILFCHQPGPDIYCALPVCDRRICFKIRLQNIYSPSVTSSLFAVSVGSLSITSPLSVTHLNHVRSAALFDLSGGTTTLSNSLKSLFSSETVFSMKTGSILNLNTVSASCDTFAKLKSSELDGGPLVVTGSFSKGMLSSSFISGYGL
ncbi:hypothetical protein BLNAU_9978 [Blattamonas nauphoetae]|uniref:Uncharacterized protein n=1 Tax=Blattamonas nauphoetae TaxID=2049346 RepID=A0ABQ9XU92_9EUKA|nr:hypothetical protein BLNAU_9978 [Blattamonas nauphoetae]